VIFLSDDKDGRYCSICGGIPADEVTVKRILVEGIETGIDHLDAIMDEVRKLRLHDDQAVGDAILQRVRIYNYVPTKRTAAYRAALLQEYHRGV
jgi:hypothetical protein